MGNSKITNDTDLNQSYGPGKFNTLRDVYFYNIANDGGCDDECGSVPENGMWYGLIYGPFEHPRLKDVTGVILIEDDQGFVNTVCYESKEVLDNIWVDLILNTTFEV
jgi:hypothetical protein